MVNFHIFLLLDGQNIQLQLSQLPDVVEKKLEPPLESSWFPLKIRNSAENARNRGSNTELFRKKRDKWPVWD